MTRLVLTGADWCLSGAKRGSDWCAHPYVVGCAPHPYVVGCAPHHSGLESCASQKLHQSRPLVRVAARGAGPRWDLDVLLVLLLLPIMQATLAIALHRPRAAGMPAPSSSVTSSSLQASNHWTLADTSCNYLILLATSIYGPRIPKRGSVSKKAAPSAADLSIAGALGPQPSLAA